MNAGKTILIATAAASLFLTGAVGARAAEQSGGDKVMCEGVTSCKGKGECATAQNQCAGKNGCKGKGAMEMSAADCKAKGGTAQPKKD